MWKFIVRTSALSALALAASSTPVERLPVFSTFENAIPGHYIVKLRDGATTESVLGFVNITEPSHIWPSLNGFAGKFSAAQLDALKLRPDVQFIEEVVPFQLTMGRSGTDSSDAPIIKDKPTMSTDGFFYTQYNAPWGISRISVASRHANQNPTALNFPYTYWNTYRDHVDVYVLDSGIYAEHAEFGGRVRWADTNIIGTPYKDVYGHGTMVSGVIASGTYGVSKAAYLVAVKMAGDMGEGSTITLAAALDYIYRNVCGNGRNSIVNMSIIFPGSGALDAWLSAIKACGIHLVAAAGNGNTDARGSQPAGSTSVITVGASNIADGRYGFSNFGPSVDVFAPGVNIWTTSNVNPTSTALGTGTSMAAPHVSGLIAYFIMMYGSWNPDYAKSVIDGMCRRGILSDIPPGTPNMLVQNGVAYRLALGPEQQVLM